MTWLLITLLAIMALDMLVSAVAPEKHYNRVRTTYAITATRIGAIVYVLVLFVTIAVVSSR